MSEVRSSLTGSLAVVQTVSQESCCYGEERSGKIHPAFKPDSASRHIRNGVGVPSPDTALFVISKAPVSFYEFATLFCDKLHCPDALFLDGTISSLYAPALKRSDSRADLGPIIAVTE